MRDFFESAEEVRRAGETLEAKMPEADCEAARVLLADFMAVIEKYRDNPNTLISGNAYFSELAIYQIRLAHIARRQGQEADATRYEAEAIESCKKSGWSSCELSVLQRVVGEMNKSLRGKCF